MVPAPFRRRTSLRAKRHQLYVETLVHKGLQGDMNIYRLWQFWRPKPRVDALLREVLMLRPPGEIR